VDLPGVYLFADNLQTSILSNCPIETSTVVFRRQALLGIRFRSEFRHAYEDYMFWFEIASRSPRVAFSPEIGCRYGEGLNMYRGIKPHTDESLRAVVGSTMFSAGVRAAYTLSKDQLQIVRERLNKNRVLIAYEVLHRIRRRRPIPRRELAMLFRSDPMALVVVPISALLMLFRWFVGPRGDAIGNGD
jgi:succinoglycan biosynthesis protein ExoW